MRKFNTLILAVAILRSLASAEEPSPSAGILNQRDFSRWHNLVGKALERLPDAQEKKDKTARRILQITHKYGCGYGTSYEGLKVTLLVEGAVVADVHDQEIVATRIEPKFVVLRGTRLLPQKAKPRSGDPLVRTVNIVFDRLGKLLECTQVVLRRNEAPSHATWSPADILKSASTLRRVQAFAHDMLIQFGGRRFLKSSRL